MGEVYEYDQIKAQVMHLSLAERMRLVEEVVSTFRADIEASHINKLREEKPNPWYGLCADLGPAPSAEDIDEIRREMWKNFPREDI